MMIRGFGRNEHGARRLDDFDAEDNEVDETMVGALWHVLLLHIHVQYMSL